MASPFALFRKNQKILMVVFGLMAMIAFVFFDSMGPIVDPGNPSNTLVAESDHLKLHELEVDIAVRNRSIVHQFLTKALASSIEQRQFLQLQQELKGESEETIRAQLAEMQARIYSSVNMAVIRRIGVSDEKSVVDNLVLADLAKRSGVQVSDTRIIKFIGEFLAAFQVDPLDGAKLDKIANSLNGVSQRRLNEAFRTELLAGAMRDYLAYNPAFSPSTFNQLKPLATPIDRWNYYTRKNLRATAEVVAVRTSDLVKAKKVPEPQERELAAFYEEYKFEEPTPGSPDPGFKIPQQAAFQYFAADESKFMEPEKITAAEIAEHYEKNKARYPYTPEDFSEPVKKEEPKVEVPKATTPAATTVNPTPPAPVPSATAPAPAATAKPQATAPATPASTPSATAVPAPTPSASAVPPAPKPSASATTPAAGSCENDEADSDGCQTPAPTASATPSATPSATASATPTASPSAPASTAKPQATPSATPVATTPASTPLPPTPLPSEDVMLPTDIRTGRDPQYDPLWKVEDKVRKELAEAGARKRIQTIFDELKATLNNKAIAQPFDVPKGTVLPPLFTADEWRNLAKPYPGLIAETTDVVSRITIDAQADQPGLYHSTIGGRPFAQFVFASRALNVPTQSIEIPESTGIEAIVNPRKSVSYLFWKTTDVEARVPELKEIRNEVVFAWQTRTARKTVQDEAASMAKRVRESSKSMAELFPDRQVKLTNAFTWFKPDLSGGFGRQAPLVLSEVDNVEDAGADFMETVFSLDPDQVATAFNNPQTVCYVVRALTISPPRQQLYQTFLADQFQSYMQYGETDAERLANGATKTMLVNSGLRWLREPKEFDPNQ
ncbi:MAG: hypothetical protein K8U03_03590 [Planctomycetia bacterium]|nr:hypothetical protein [Planctomycetia bacterium]